MYAHILAGNLSIKHEQIGNMVVGKSLMLIGVNFLIRESILQEGVHLK